MFLSRGLTCRIISLGCSKNQVDAERLNGFLFSAGFREALSEDDADILIVNTCGFIEDAKRESIEVVLDALEAQKSRPGSPRPYIRRSLLTREIFHPRLAVVGCLCQRYPEALRSDIPEADFIYGLIDDNLLREMCGAFQIRCERGESKTRRPLVHNLPYDYIKIAEGCSNNCSYCAIPLIRGPLKPATPASILKDAKEAVDRGAVELNLIAQDITSYSHGGRGLAHLVRRISAIPGVEWVRLLYCHPDHLDESVIREMRDNPRVVRYLDLPFQHASVALLRSMGRKGSFESYRALIEEARREIPGLRIRSTFMVGYPGEGKEEFAELLRFVKTMKLDRVGCFIYSPEEGTRASSLPDITPLKEKRSRYRRLMTIQRNISKKMLADMVGSEVRVLIDERIDRQTWAGRTEFDAPEVDGIFYLTAKNVSLNTIVKAKVTDSFEYDLTGVLC